MEARTAAAHAQLVESVTGMAHRDGWRAWLDFAARMPHYSVSNQLLLCAQAPNASLVMSAAHWRQIGRYPARGSTALRIWAPSRATARGTRATRLRDDAPESDEAREAEAKPQSRFILVPVFDVAQTDGEPLPEQPTPMPPPPGEAPVGMWPELVDYADQAGYAVVRGECGQADGVTRFDQHTITIAERGSPLAQALTLAHEIGHATLHADPAQRQHGRAHRGRVEVEAESVAYLVAADYGLADAYPWHFDYLAHWAAALTGPDGDPDTTRGAIRDTAARVLAAARPVLTHLREHSVGHSDAPTPARSPALAVTSTIPPAPIIEATVVTP
jgi:hypothetical protein